MNIITFPAISRMPFSFPWAGSISIMRYLRLLIKTGMVYSGFQPCNCEALGLCLQMRPRVLGTQRCTPLWLPTSPTSRPRYNWPSAGMEPRRKEGVFPVPRPVWGAQGWGGSVLGV